MADIIKSYLVSLSANVDKASFNNFQAALGGAEKTVQSSMGSIAGNFLKFEVAGITAFASVGFGIIGYVDKLAMADAAMRRTAQQNMMSVEQYRALQNTLSAVGMTLDDAFRGTPEDRQRFREMYDHMAQLETMLGGSNFEDRMVQMRQIHDQIAMLEEDAEYFGMKLMSDLLGKMGFGNDGLLAQLQQFNNFVMLNMPLWSDEISTDIVPVLKDFWGILKDLGSMGLVAANAFTNLEGALTGNDSLQGKTTSFHQFAGAVGDAVHQLAELLKIMLDLEKIGVNLGSATLSASEAAARQAAKILGIDIGNGGEGSGARAKGSLGDAWSDARDIWGILSGKSSYDKSVSSPTTTLSGYMDSQAPSSVAAEVARLTGIPANLIYGQMAFETGQFSHMAGTNNLSGIKIPGTDTFQNFASLSDYEKTYAATLNENRYVLNGIRGATTGAEFARALSTPSGTYYGSDSQDAYGAGVDRYARQYTASIGTINVYSSPNLTPEQHASTVQQAVRAALNQHVQQGIIETNGAYAQ